MKRVSPKIKEVMNWFKNDVTYKGEVYTIDQEQAAAVVCDALNTIVVARAGSGKTRTIVAKIVYLVAKCGISAKEIIAFVFNANAAREINTRLAEMRVNGERVFDKEANIQIANTFHAFSRKVVFDICDRKRKCGMILAGEKEMFVYLIVQDMMKSRKWGEKIWSFVKNEDSSGQEEIEDILYILEEEELLKFSSEMSNFINRAQQKFLGGGKTLAESVKNYLLSNEVSRREQLFIELGLECYKRYHYYLLKKMPQGEARRGEFVEYGTDFNLIVSWASRLIEGGSNEIMKLLSKKEYVLIDEYQDFSQLFLAEIVAIREVAKHAKLFVVGDDWQAINRFAGSEVEYFKEFERFFPRDVKRLVISTNYRCNRGIVSATKNFMMRAMREKGDFRAFNRRFGKVALVDPRETELDYGVVEYDARVNRADRKLMAVIQKIHRRFPKKKTVQYLKTVLELIKDNLGSDILILHRNNETNLEGMSLKKIGEILREIVREFNVMDVEDFESRVKLMTMHKSKGLESEVVIILEADEGVIPKTHSDTKLYSVFGETEEIAFYDQIRLFYVAMTRAKKRLYIIHDSLNGAGFTKYLGKSVEKWGE